MDLRRAAEALSQPDMLAEAVDLIRQSAHMGCLCDFVHGCESCKLVAKCWNFVRRYDAAQQEQNDA